MHFLTVFWKVLFAFVPPTEYWNGWACFFVSISLIGVLTAVTGDLASHFGCTVGLKDSVTAVVFVALGTSVPGRCLCRGIDLLCNPSGFSPVAQKQLLRETYVTSCSPELSEELSPKLSLSTLTRRKQRKAQFHSYHRLVFPSHHFLNFFFFFVRL